MPGVNFGQLQQIAQPQVVGSIPAAPNNDLNSLAGGTLQGLVQADQLRNTALARKATQQQMDQSAALFPGQQQLQAQQIETGNMALEERRRQVQTAAEMKAEYQKSVEAGDAYMQQNDPVGHAKMMVDRGNYSKSLAEAGKLHAETDKQALENVQQMQIAGANMAQSAMNGRTPEERQAIWSMNLNYLEQQSPEIAKIYPKEFNEGTYLTLTGSGMEALIQQKEAAELKEATPEIKNARKKAQLREKIARGTATDEDILTLEEMNNSEKKDIKDKSFQNANVLRDDFRVDTQDYNDVNASFQRIQATAKNPSAAGDIALIFNYMKMLDPRSVVREGEFATAQNAGSVPERVRALYNKISKGERLTEVQRKDFLRQSENIYEAQGKLYDKQVKAYKKRAERAGLNPDDVILNVREPKTPVNYDAMAEEAIKQGADPKAVEERLNQLKAGK